MSNTCRQQYVESYIALAPPFGGSTYAIASKLGGNRVNLLQILGNFLQPVLNEVMYHGSRGLPSMLMLMPYQGIWGREHVRMHAHSTEQQDVWHRKHQCIHCCNEEHSILCEKSLVPTSFKSFFCCKVVGNLISSSISPSGRIWCHTRCRLCIEYRRQMSCTYLT